MTRLRNKQLFRASSLSYPGAFLYKLMKTGISDRHCSTKVVSSGQSVYVHTALLTNASAFLSEILSSCPCETNVLILPHSPPSTLKNFVSLLYTGYITGLSGVQTRDLMNITKGLNLNVSSEEHNSEFDDVNCDSENSDSCDPPILFEDNEQNNNTERNELKVKSNIKSKGIAFELSFPLSRSNRDMTGGIDIVEEMTGFKGRIQKEYNAHPVGKYMGPYDQNKNLKLKIQIPNSKFDFKTYTN